MVGDSDGDVSSLDSQHSPPLSPCFPVGRPDWSEEQDVRRYLPVLHSIWNVINNIFHNSKWDNWEDSMRWWLDDTRGTTTYPANGSRISKCPPEEHYLPRSWCVAVVTVFHVHCQVGRKQFTTFWWIPVPVLLSMCGIHNTTQAHPALSGAMKRRTSTQILPLLPVHSKGARPQQPIASWKIQGCESDFSNDAPH